MEIIRGLGGAIFIIFTADLLGKFALSFSSFKNVYSARVGMGFAIISFIIFFLGGQHLNKEWILLFSSLFFVLSVCNCREYSSKIISLWRDFKQADYFDKFLLFVIFSYFGLILLNTLTPPIARDELNYHLFLPKIWLKEGKIFTLPQNIYSFFPHFWEMIYLYCLIIGNDISAKLLHFFSLLLSLTVISHIGRLIYPEMKQRYIMLSCLIFISTPVINRVSSFAYVDMAQLYYLLLSFYLLLWFKINGVYSSQRREDKVKGKDSFYLSAIFCGCALSIKYLSLIWILFIPFFILYKRNKFEALKLILLYLSLSFICASPYYIRNYTETNNPFFPFFHNFFGGSFLDNTKSNLFSLYFESFGYGYNLKDLLLLPFRLSFYARFDDPHKFDGELGVVYLLLVLMCFKYKYLYGIVKSIPNDNHVIARRFSSEAISNCVMRLLRHFVHRNDQVLCARINFTNQQFLVRLFLWIPFIYLLIWFYLSQQMRFLIFPLVLFVIFSGVFLSRLNSKYVNSILIGLIAVYMYYPINIIIKEKPHYFISGKEKRDEFLKRNIYIYSLVKRINESLPNNAKIMLVNVDPIAYYIESNIFQESIFEDWTLIKKIEEGGVNSVINFLRDNRVNYILINERRTSEHFSYYNHIVADNYNSFKNNQLELKMFKGDFKLYEVNLSL